MITGRKTGSCGILIGPAADTEQHCRAENLESITRRCQVAVQDLGKLDTGRKWLSGRASTCQGETQGKSGSSSAVERVLAKDEVEGSNPFFRSITFLRVIPYLI